MNAWIARFDLPDHITSDRVSVFTFELWFSLTKLLGTRLHRTTSYHTLAHGMVERSHRILKVAVTARCSGQNWMSHLPWVLLGLRTTPKEGLTASPAEMDTDLDRLRRILAKYAPSKLATTSDKYTYQKPSAPASTFLSAMTPPSPHCRRPTTARSAFFNAARKLSSFSSATELTGSQ